jgi:hypothetical protein
MKVKGANFFELHIEKIVMAVVAAVFVLVLVVQLGAEGPTVTVNNQKTPLEQAYEPAENEAKLVRTRMNAQDPELPEIGERVDLLARFREARAAELAPRDRIVFGRTIGLAIDGGDPFDNRQLAELVIPAPGEPAAYSFAATLDPWAVQDTDGLAALLPSGQPYDKAAVSVQATFDSSALNESLSAEPGGELSAWPISWWRGSIEILAVRLERQRQNSDGSWPEEVEAVPTPPGLLDIPAELAEQPELSPGELKAAVQEVQRGLAQRVRRPAFYPIIAGEPWVEPREGMRLAGLEIGADPELAALERRLSQVDAGIERGQGELAELGAGPGARQGAQPQQGDRAREAQIRRLEGRLEGLRRQRERVVAELTDLGHPPEEPAEEQEPGARRQGQRQGGRAGVDSESLASGQPIQVWAHDITAEPGETYRYRVVLELNNPAYGQSQFLIEEQRHLAEPVTVLSTPSAWSTPVMAPPMTAFFVTSGSEAQQGAMGVRMANAGVEVFTFLYGYYRKGAASLEPGDPVAAWADLPEGLPIFDIDQPPPAGGPVMPAPVREQGRRARRGQEQDGVLPVRTLAAADAYLLDVYESAAREAGAVVQGRAPRIVTFGDAQGQVLRRLVGGDRRSPLYGRLSASAAAGRNQGQPGPEPEQQEDQRRGREPPVEPPPAPPGGGGGGGG